MRERDLSLGKYLIGKYTYRELKNLCLQYPENKHKMNSVLEVQAIQITGMPHGSDIGNPTEAKAIILSGCRAECEMIESTAKEAAGEVWKYLLKNVTEGIRYEETKVPCGRRQFFDKRKYFYYLLAKKKGKI